MPAARGVVQVVVSVFYSLVIMAYMYVVIPNARGGDLVSTLPGCVCRKVKDMGPFLASSE